ncbi:MAG: ABC transporter ATP-binding protein [Culicoidibacterales bacterium]
MIKVRNISKKFGNKLVVDDVSFDIQEGKVTSFIGPNGAGKSTILGIISRLTQATSGDVEIKGKKIGKWKTNDLSRTLSILKQANDIHVRLTVKQLVSFGRFPYSKSKLSIEDNEHINRAISFMELEDFEEKYLDELSGGQKQRAYIAMVIAQDTEYILLDEPLNNLDIKHSIQMMRTLNRLAKEYNKTIIIVMHDINFSASYSDYVIAMKNGKKIHEGTVKEIIKEEVLKEIYDINLRVRNIDQCQICLYN